MEIKVNKKGKVAILRCSGTLDADTMAVFKKHTSDLFNEGVVKLVLDATDLAFIDSMGLGAIISVMRRVREKDGDIKICGLNHDVEQIFEITRLNKLFDVCKNDGEACKKFT